MRLCGQPGETGARPRDLSLTGLSLICALPIAKGSNPSVVALNFDAIAWAVACRVNRRVHSVHARLLTPEILRSGRGTRVSTQAGQRAAVRPWLPDGHTAVAAINGQDINFQRRT